MSKQSHSLVTLTEALLRAGMKGGIGLKAAQARILGLKYPLKAGWVQGVLGKELSESEYERFLMLAGDEFRKKRRKKKRKNRNSNNHSLPPSPHHNI